jgi:hypothetical protein
MASTLKALVAVSLLSFIAACAQRGTDDVAAVAVPITSEPVFTGKYN